MRALEGVRYICPLFQQSQTGLTDLWLFLSVSIADNRNLDDYLGLGAWLLGTRI